MVVLQSGVDPELDLRGGGLNCLLHLETFLTLLFAIGNTAIWEVITPWVPLDPPLPAMNSIHLNFLQFYVVLIDV